MGTLIEITVHKGRRGVGKWWTEIYVTLEQDRAMERQVTTNTKANKKKKKKKKGRTEPRLQCGRRHRKATDRSDRSPRMKRVSLSTDPLPILHNFNGGKRETNEKPENALHIRKGRWGRRQNRGEGCLRNVFASLSL